MGTSRGTPNDQLMKKMGSKRGFDPCPPDQHEWPRKVDKVVRVTHDVIVLWSWLAAHTIGLGHRSPYAVDKDGHARYIEDAARDLEWDEGNCRRAWRQGEALNLWRNGAGKQSRHLYFNGEVKPIEDDSLFIKAGGEGKHCTDLLPAYILNGINKLSPEKGRKVRAEYEAEIRFRQSVLADLTATARLVFTQREDTLLARYGIKKIREVQEPKKARAKENGREARVQMLLPEVERFIQAAEQHLVQTFSGSVQPPENGFVQRDSGGASLFSSETTEIDTVRAYSARERGAAQKPAEDARTHARDNLSEGQKELLAVVAQELQRIAERFPQWHVDNPEAAARSIAEACDWDQEFIVAVFRDFANRVAKTDRKHVVKSAAGLIIAHARRLRGEREKAMRAGA
jgi:hypothetical protein